MCVEIGFGKDHENNLIGGAYRDWYRTTGDTSEGIDMSAVRHSVAVKQPCDMCMVPADSTISNRMTGEGRCQTQG